MDPIFVQPDPPAFAGLDHASAERLGHDLVAEADSDELRLALRAPQKTDQRRDPG